MPETPDESYYVIRRLADVLADHGAVASPVLGRVTCSCKEWRGLDIDLPMHVARILVDHGVTAPSEGVSQT